MGSYSNAFSLGVSEDVFAITPTDADGIVGANGTRKMVRQIYATGAGNIKYTSTADVVETIAVPAGFVLECAVKRVWSTGTTATGLLGYV